MNITRRTFLAGAVAGVGMETARAAGTGPSAGAETPKGAPNVTFGVLSDVHLERRGFRRRARGGSWRRWRPRA